MLHSAICARKQSYSKIGRVFLPGTSVAANYRAACKARSHAEFVAKIGIVLEEADESKFWLDFLVQTSIVSEAAARLIHCRILD